MQNAPIVSTRQIVLDLSFAVALALGVGVATGAMSLGLVCLLASLGA